MQLGKCINCFLKTHNKQLNQYCLNFTIFTQKKFKKNGSSRGSGRVDLQKKHGLGHGSTCFCFKSKKSGSHQVFFGLDRVRLENSDSFCHVYVIEREILFFFFFLRETLTLGLLTYQFFIKLVT